MSLGEPSVSVYKYKDLFEKITPKDMQELSKFTLYDYFDESRTYNKAQFIAMVMLLFDSEPSSYTEKQFVQTMYCFDNADLNNRICLKVHFNDTNQQGFLGKQ